jgi:amidase
LGHDAPVTASTWLDATAQAELVRCGDASPSELLDDALARIGELNPQLNAVIRCREQAHAEAADPGLPDGPFRGVPFLLKDCLAHSAGDPYHCGMRVLKDAGWVEQRDTWLVERIRRAGFVIAGTTNLPELASTVTTEPLAYGPTHNPWSLEHSPGGSSGGSAAAVASGMVAVAHGNDMGGSIRIPASMCGLVGLKPSRARSTLGPDFGEYWAMTTHEHVLTRSVRDTAAVLDAVAGAGVGDPYTAPPPSRPFLEEVGADPGRLRIGIRTERANGLGESHDDGVAAVRAAAEVLAEMGHVVEDAAVPAIDDERLAEAVGAVFGVFIAREIDRWSERLGRSIADDEIEPWNAMLANLGRATTASAYVRGVELAQAYSRDVVQWWADGNDLLVTPMVTDRTPRLGDFGPTVEPLEQFGRFGVLTGFTIPFNLTGQPAISLPLHWGTDGLPIGVQLVAAPWREDLLLRVAAALEAAMPWAERRPPISAS